MATQCLYTPQEALADKYSKFDEASGEPTHDKEGNALEGKVGLACFHPGRRASLVLRPASRTAACLAPLMHLTSHCCPHPTYQTV